MNFDKINTDGFISQDIPYQCPECNYELRGTKISLYQPKFECIIGYGDYAPNMFRLQVLHDDQSYGLCFECPRCFTKSICHAPLDFIEMLQNEKR